MVVWYILWSFGIFCGRLVYFVVVWYILCKIDHRFGMLYQVKPANHEKLQNGLLRLRTREFWKLPLKLEQEQGDQMGEFSSIGRLFSSGSFSKNTKVVQFFAYVFPRSKH
jgi:hypothetical protein